MAVTYYVALFTATGEVAAPDYSRKQCDFDIVEGRTANVSHVDWLPRTGWGVVVSFGLFATPTGGNPAYQAQLTQPVDMTAGVWRRFSRGRIRFPESLLATALADEVLPGQAELGLALPPVELESMQYRFPAPSGLRAMAWGRRLI